MEHAERERSALHACVEEESRDDELRALADDEAPDRRREVAVEPGRAQRLVLRIDALLGGAPPVPELERTVTDGYATALALEGERLRIDRQMDGVAASINGDPAGAKELSALAARRASLDKELSHLRERLGLLKQRASEVRAAVPQPGLS